MKSALKRKAVYLQDKLTPCIPLSCSMNASAAIGLILQRSVAGQLCNIMPPWQAMGEMHGPKGFLWLHSSHCKSFHRFHPSRCQGFGWAMVSPFLSAGTQLFLPSPKAKLCTLVSWNQAANPSCLADLLAWPKDARWRSVERVQSWCEFGVSTVMGLPQ